MVKPAATSALSKETVACSKIQSETAAHTWFSSERAAMYRFFSRSGSNNTLQAGAFSCIEFMDATLFFCGLWGLCLVSQLTTQVATRTAALESSHWQKTQEAVADTIHPHITSYYPVKNLSLVLDPVIFGVPILRHPSLRHKKRPGVGGHQACKAWISQRQHLVKRRGFCKVHLHCGSTWKMTVRRKLEVVRDIFVILWYDMPGLNALSFDLMAFQLACLGHRLPKSDSVTTRESKRSTGGGKQPRKLRLSQTFPFLHRIN